MGEYEFYGTQGFTQDSLQDRRYAFFGGPPGNIDDLRRAWYITQLSLPVDIAASVNDLEHLYYRALGGVGSLQDQRSQYWSGTIAPVDPNEPGLMAHFDFNDPGDTETYDRVANVRMALSEVTKVPAYNGLGASMPATTSEGVAADGFVNQDAFTIAVRQIGPGGGGVEFPSATGTAIRCLSRDTGTLKSFLMQAWQGGTIFSAGISSSQAAYAIPADVYYWTFLEYDGTGLAAYYNNMLLKGALPLTGPIDDPVSMRLYRNASSLVDDVRVFDYAIDETKRLELIGE